MVNTGTKSIDWLMGLLLVVLVAGAVLPIAFASLNTMESDATNFSAGERALIAVLGIIIFIMFIYRIYKGEAT